MKCISMKVCKRVVNVVKVRVNWMEHSLSPSQRSCGSIKRKGSPTQKKKQAGRNHLELWRPIKSAPKGKISNKIPWTSSAARRGAPQKKAGARFNYCELTAVRKIIFSLAQDAALSIHIHISQLERFAGFFNFVSLKKKKEGNYPRRPRTFSLATAPWHADDSIARKIFR